MFRFLRHPSLAVVAGVSIALLHNACASPSTRPDQDRAGPTVWSAQLPDSGNTFLLASVHLGTEDIDLGPAAEWAFSDAAELVLEVDFSKYGKAESVALKDRYGRIPSPDKLRDLLSKQTYGLFEAYLARRRLFAEPFQHLQPWFLSTAVAVLEYQALGYESQRGVDRVLMARAKGRKSVVGLETLESRFEVLAGLPKEAQDRMLRDTLERAEVFASAESELTEAWRRGDDDALSGIVFSGRDVPELAPYFERFVFDRNERMAERIAELATDGKSRLVIVGAAHMLGEKGIPAQLLARGFQVEKVDR